MKVRCAILALALAGCAPPPRVARRPEPEGARLASTIASPTRAEPSEAEVRWPRELVVGHGEDPALFRGSGPTSRGFAWIAEGTPLSLRGGVRRGRARAHVDGPLRVRGWIDVDRLEGVVLERGRVTGTPLYVVPGDRVRVIEVAGDTALVEASAHLAHPSLARSPLFRGSFPLDRLGAAPEGSGEGPTPGRAARLHVTAALTSRPGGEALWEIPALDPPLPITVLREDGEHVGVRIGAGPYLVGFVPRSALEPAPRKQGMEREVLDPWAPDRVAVEPSVRDPWSDTEDDAEDEAESEAEPSDPLPPRLRAAVVRTIWRVRAGARVQVDGVTVAIFREPGLAIEMGRAGDRVDVLAAVDETVTVRGTVPLIDLSALDHE